MRTVNKIAAEHRLLKVYSDSRWRLSLQVISLTAP